jgi:putative MATE family efflux protein
MNFMNENKNSVDPRERSDLTVGSVPAALLRFSLPLLLGNVLQLAYGMADRFWAGRFLGKEALGAVSLASLAIFVLIGFAWGVTMGSSILVSQAWGAKDAQGVRRAVANSFVVGGVLALLCTLLISGLSRPVLSLMGTPPEVMGQAAAYLSVMGVGVALIFGFNLVSSIFRAIGDSVTPLKFLALAVTLNAALDPVFMLGWGPIPGMGVAGAAAATVFAEGIAFFWSIRYLQRQGGDARVVIARDTIDAGIMGRILRLGLPTGVQQVIISLGITVIQWFINAYGTDAIAAIGAQINIDNLFFLPSMSLHLAVAAMVGQNVGAGRFARARRTLAWGLVFCAASSLTFALLSLVVPEALLRPFLREEDAAALRIGVSILRILALPYLCVTAMVVFNGFFNGTGDTAAAMVMSLVSLWGVRIPSVWLLQSIMGLDGVWWGIAVGYVGSVVPGFIYYSRGFWRRKALASYRSHHAAVDKGV